MSLKRSKARKFIGSALFLTEGPIRLIRISNYSDEDWRSAAMLRAPISSWKPVSPKESWTGFQGLPANSWGFTEDSMNPTDAKDIRSAFKKQKYRILIVANKFQTGFDQPLLHTM